MITLAEINQHMEKLKDWDMDVNTLVKTFHFENSKASIDFVNKIMEIADEMNHHPDIFISYNIVKLSLITHSENSLSSADFKLAEAIDKITPENTETP